MILMRWSKDGSRIMRPGTSSAAWLDKGRHMEVW